MTKEKKLLFFIASITILVFVYIFIKFEYEKERVKVTPDFEEKEYSADEVREMIKASADYQGDSLYINWRGRLVSMDHLMQSIIEQMYEVEANLGPIKGHSRQTNEPVPYLVYIQAAYYYKQQAGDKSARQDTIQKQP